MYRLGLVVERGSDWLDKYSGGSDLAVGDGEWQWAGCDLCTCWLFVLLICSLSQKLRDIEFFTGANGAIS